MRPISFALLILCLLFISVFVFQVRHSLQIIKKLENPPDFNPSFIPSGIAKNKAIEVLNHLQDFTNVNPEAYISDMKVSANDRGKPIDVKSENQKASQWLQGLAANNINSMAMIIPGYVSELKDPEILSDIAKLRVKLGMLHFREGQHSVIILTGGNVHPQSTPYNEAMEMKKYILEKYKLPEHYILIEPYADNSVMNLNFSGKIMSVHNIKKAHIVTTPVHNYYFGHPYISGFHLRSLYLLGKITGKLTLLERCVSEFVLESN